MPWGGSSWGGVTWGGSGSLAQGGSLSLDVQLKGRIKGPEPLPIGDLDLLTIDFTGKLKARPAVLAGQLALPLGVGDDLFAPMKVSNIPIFWFYRAKAAALDTLTFAETASRTTLHAGRSVAEAQAGTGPASRSAALARSVSDTRGLADAAVNGPAFTLVASANGDGSGDGSFGTSYATLGLAFTLTSPATIKRVELRWGTAVPDASGTVTLATAAAPTTPLVTADSMTAAIAKANSWEAFDFTPVSLSSGVEYIIAINGPGNGLVYRATGTSVFSGLTATRLLYSGSWASSLSGYTGSFRLYA